MKKILLSLIIALTLFGCKNDSNINIDTNSLATPNNVVISPSGKYKLEVVEGYDGNVKFNRFQIIKVGTPTAEPSIAFISNDTFRIRDTLYFFWDDEDRVWVYSGDVGTFFWEKTNEENWKKYAYVENKEVPVPQLLIKLKPNLFN